MRKLGAPGRPELGLGAIAEGGAVFLDPEAARSLRVSPEQLAKIAEHEAHELGRRARLYHGGRPLPPLAQKTVVLVDDGIATGESMRAAIRAVRELHPRRVVVAAPVIAADMVPELHREADALACLIAPEKFQSVGRWYEDFAQVSDAEVLQFLAAARRPAEPGIAPRPAGIPCGGEVFEGLLGIPRQPRGLVIFVHGSGSSRFSRRNQHVAHALRQAGFATLLLDLLTPGEETLDELSGHLRFDLRLLADRVGAALHWADSDPVLHALPIGLFGASTGAAAALLAAADRPQLVQAVVSRGGRPDLATRADLLKVRAPALFIVGGEDRAVLALTRETLKLFGLPCELAVIPGATHLFEEPGALDEVAQLALGWFARHLRPAEAIHRPERRPPP